MNAADRKRVKEAIDAKARKSPAMRDRHARSKKSLEGKARARERRAADQERYARLYAATSDETGGIDRHAHVAGVMRILDTQREREEA